MSAQRDEATSSPDVRSLIDRVLNDRYRVHSIIARGGMGTVYLAEQLPLRLACALKVVTPQDVTAAEANLFERFTEEASNTARLRHPNTVAVFDFGRTRDDIFYLAMELLDGRTLAQALKSDGAFALPRFFRIAKQIAAGVNAAHALGIVHRDLKPANVFLVHPSDGEELAKVLDFGIAKRMRGDGPALTAPGRVLGTPKYMAPEQVLAGAVDQRTDIYALGVIFYEMLVGRPPFEIEDAVEMMAAHVKVPVPKMRERNAAIAIPAELEALVLRMLAKSPDARHSSLTKVLDVLAHLEGTGMTPRPVLAAPVEQVARDVTKTLSSPMPAPALTIVSTLLPSVGTVLGGKYRLDGLLGAGQSGTVFAATHMLTRRPVAVKCMHLGAADDTAASERCLREAQNAGRIDHPSIIEVLDVGTEGGRPYFVMERLKGMPLSQALAAFACGRAEAVSLVASVIRGLAAAHRAGVIHADIKTSDLMFCEDADGKHRLVLLDFGVSRLIDEPHLRMTRGGPKTVLPFYASPEQLRKLPYDNRADVYAIAVVLYEIVTGRVPFEGRTYGEVVLDIATREVVPPHELAENVPEPLSAVIMQALSRDPWSRFATMDAFAEALSPFTRPADIVTSRIRTHVYEDEDVVLPVNTMPVRAIVIAVVVVIVLAALALAMSRT